jgi:DNA-binding XRE family transcriptional regulator
MSKTAKFYIYYDAKTDYLEVSSGKMKTVSEDIGNGIFILKNPRGRAVGYGVLDACDRVEKLDFLDPLVKFAVQVKIERLKRGFTQAQLAKRMGIGLLPCQRLESGQNNPTLKTILKLKEILPEVSVDDLLAS